jgi:FkbM family methyltransferase
MIARIIRRLKYSVKRELFNYFKYFKKPFTYQLLNGKKIKFYTDGQIAKGIYTGGFEKLELELFQKILRTGMNVIDAGANIGLYSTIASNIIGSTGKIWAFEPSKENYNLLVKNLQLNHCDNVSPHNSGLGDKINQTLTLRKDAGYGDAEKYINPEDFVLDKSLENVGEIETTENVKLTTIDIFMEKNSIQTVDFIKIDTEGYEYFILKGAKQLIKSNPQIIFLMECTILGNERMGLSQNDVFTFLLNELNLNIYYWNTNNNYWGNDLQGAKVAGNIWVCQNINQLPTSE